VTRLTPRVVTPVARRAAALAAAALAAAAGAAPAGADVVPGEVIVRFADGATAAQRTAARAAAGAGLDRRLPVPGAQLLSLPAGASVRGAVAALERQDGVAYAEPNAERRLAAVPSDPLLPSLWALVNLGQALPAGAGTTDADIDGTEAFDVTLGSPQVTVAVVDTGVATDHPDLAGARFANPGEAGALAANGRDDDLNGFADDRGGWDWVGRDPQPDDENGHGTHVAGTILARADNGVGIAGVAPQATLLPLRVLDAGGGGTVADTVAAYRYAVARGARVVNLSFGGPDISRVERDAIAAAPGTLFVVAAGNGGADGLGDDNDAVPDYPCSHELANVVCVTATDASDRLPAFANTGARSVDVGAPGVDILSTAPRSDVQYDANDYAWLTGTSMAAPHASGAAALVFSRLPGASASAVRETLLLSADRVPALDRRTVSGGRLNVARALTVTPPGAGGSPAVSAAATVPAPEPPPAPVQQPPPALPRDTAAPLVRAAVARRQRLGRVRERGLRGRITCSEACRADATLTVSRAAGRRLGLRGRGRTAILGRASRTLPGRRPTLVAVRPSRAAAGRLRRLRSVRALLTIAVRDALGNARTVRIAVRLAR
jgi:subtilisin family serine protease